MPPGLYSRRAADRSSRGPRTEPECKDQVNPPKLPPDPSCQGDECLLEKAKHLYRQGAFCYVIVVVRDDGTVKYADPKLIINP